MERPRLLCISPSFAPQTTPTAIRAGALLERLAARWEVTVLTEAGAPVAGSAIEVVQVPSRRPRRLLRTLRRLRQDKLIELLVWPDETIFWVPAAVRAGRRLLRERRYQAVVAFMMPYSAGLAGMALARDGGLPLVLNMDDSPTCTDMHPIHPSPLHLRLARRLEDRYVRRAEQIVYVSARNLERVAERQPAALRERMRLVRYGAEPTAFKAGEQAPGRFEILYVGAMSGWWSLIGERGSPLARAHRAWSRLGRHEEAELDVRTSSPVFVARAVRRLLAAHPDWAGRVTVTVWGNPYPEAVVERALAATGVADLVAVHGPLPHAEVAAKMGAADLLFLTLPRRPDGSPGGRISAKTYEYLMTDRPILAAVPAGENRDFLEGRAGVWLADPADEAAMARAIEPLVAQKLAGAAHSIDRSRERAELSYERRAEDFAAAIDAAIERREPAR
jgi:glycosyltransferase involved in cell wall biosynthesis